MSNLQEARQDFVDVLARLSIKRQKRIEKSCLFGIRYGHPINHFEQAEVRAWASVHIEAEHSNPLIHDYQQRVLDHLSKLDRMILEMPLQNFYFREYDRLKTSWLPNYECPATVVGSVNTKSKFSKRTRNKFTGIDQPTQVVNSNHYTKKHKRKK